MVDLMLGYDHTIPAVTSRTDKIEVQLLAEGFRGLRTDVRISWYFELVTCISGIMLVYLSENNYFNDAEVASLFLRANYGRNYFVGRAYPLVR